MRWFVEVSRVGEKSSDEKYCVEAKQWQADEVSLHYRICTNALVEKAHQLGLGVVVWTVNQRRLMRQFVRNAVDAIITNFPEQLQGERSGELLRRSDHD